MSTQAFIGGDVTFTGAPDIVVEALTPDNGKTNQFTTTAQSGAGKEGSLAGALAVQIISQDTTEAFIKSGATVNVSGANVSLTSTDKLIATA